MNDNLCYGKQSKIGQERIKEIIQAMLERGYLCQTKDKYALLKLTDTSEQLLQGTDPFVIAYRKAEVQKTSARRGVKGLGDLSEKRSICLKNSESCAANWQKKNPFRRIWWHLIRRFMICA